MKLLLLKIEMCFELNVNNRILLFSGKYLREMAMWAYEHATATSSDPVTNEVNVRPSPVTQASTNVR